MIRYAPTFCAAILAALCAACVPPAPPPATAPPPSPPPRVSQACQDLGIRSSADFVAKQVRVMSFNPPGNPNRVVLPPPNAAGTRFAADLEAAFNAAPDSFQTQLCGLDGVVVNTSSTPARKASWGLREKKQRNPERGGRYVAISAALWGTGDHVMNYGEFETSLLHDLLPRKWPADGSEPSHLGGNPTDIPAITVLAVLAHEFGHVLWHDTMDPDRTRPTYDPNGFCPQIGGFFTKSWAGRVPRPPQWRAFAGVGQGQHSPVASDLLRHVQRQDWAKASTDIDRIYSPAAAWPSVFGAFSADEDFIETFKLAVLLQATPPLRNLPLRIPTLGKTGDIPGTLDMRPGLLQKLSCFPVSR